MSHINRSSVSFCFAVLLLAAAACTPLVHPPEKPVGESKLEQGHFITADGAKLPTRSWQPQDRHPGAVIIALHGFNDYSNFFAAPGTYLSAHGIACYAYDQRGFGGAPGRGLWSGTEAYANDLSAFALHIRTRHPGVPLYLLGESMGGAVTIAALAGNNPPAVDGAILVAPAVWGRKTMPWYQRWLLAVTAHTLPWLELTGKGMKISPSDNIEMLHSLGRDPLVIRATRVEALYGLANLMDEALSQAEKIRVPTLVQYGGNDQIIPRQPLLLMLEKMPESTRKAFYADGYHMLLRDLQAEKPLADIVAWIGDRNAPLPHGTGSLP